MSTLYLHIGPPKTGTTTIQRFLGNNRKILHQHGICFPDMGYRYRGVDRHRNGHFLVRQRPKENQEISHLEEGFCKLHELSLQYDSIILSDEGIWMDGVRMTKFWDRLSRELKEKKLDLRIIIYLRRQDLWVQSFWAQKIKVGKTFLSFQEYLKSLIESGYPMDYCAYMDMLADRFGRESLIIRVMEENQFRGPEHTLLSDFLDIFHLSLADGFPEPPEILNPKFNGTYLELKRLLNMLPCFQESRSNIFISTLLDIQSRNPFDYDFSKASFFNPGEQKLFRDSFSASNSRLAKEYLGREDGILFLEEESDVPAAEITDRDLIQDTLLVYGNILQNIMQVSEERDAELRKTIRSLQKKVDSLSMEAEALS